VSAGRWRGPLWHLTPMSPRPRSRVLRLPLPSLLPVQCPSLWCLLPPCPHSRRQLSVPSSLVSTFSLPLLFLPSILCLVGLGFPVLVVSLFIPCTAPRCVLSLLLAPL
jgi:hypothetical protein